MEKEIKHSGWCLYHLFEITGFLGAGIFGLGKAEARGAIHR
jgi:hypothetical protein